MQIETTKLKTIANFAREQKTPVSVQSVYRWEKAGKIKTIEIDGVKFVIVE